MSQGNAAVKSKTGLLSVRNLVLIAMFGAIGAVLMYIEIPLPMIAPSFYKLDVSEIPVLIGTFSMGPVAGVLIEAIKILIKLVIKPSSTAYVGELANFCMGCAFVIPAGLIYKRRKTRKRALIAMTVGTIIMTVIGIFLNAYIMLPFFSRFYGIPMDTLIAMGSAIRPAISNIFTFVALAVAPFNIIKGVIDSVITFLIYKRISIMLRPG